MKEAAGEANMTVVTIVLIAIVLGAGTLIVTNIMKGMGNSKTNICSSYGWSYNKGTKKCVQEDGTEVDVPATAASTTSAGE